MFGVSSSHTLLIRPTIQKEPWLQISNSGFVKSVVTFNSKILFVGVGIDGQLYTRNTILDNWILIPNSGNVKFIANAGEGLIGINTDNQLVYRELLDSPWKQLPTDIVLTSVSVFPDIGCKQWDVICL